MAPPFILAPRAPVTALIGTLLLGFCLTVHGAGSPSWIADANGCKVWDPYPVEGEKITWTGLCKGGFADGVGKVTWMRSDGTASTSEGPFVGGKMTGHVVMVSASGDRFEGEVLDNVKTGPGKTNFADGENYTGHYANNMENGKGVYNWKSGARYEGDFLNNQVTGKGVLTWPNGDRYEGDVVAGAMHGKGVLVKVDGTRQEGDFNNVWISSALAQWIANLTTGFNANMAKSSLSRADATQEGILLGTGDADGHFTWTLEKSSGWPEYDAAALTAIQTAPSALSAPQANYKFRESFRYGGRGRDRPYLVKQDEPGTAIKRTAVKNLAVPPGKRYADLTDDEKAIVKAQYDPMAQDDEPPYPLYGTRPILDATDKVANLTQARGLLSLAVTIDSRGTPTQVAILKSPDDETAKAVATILMLQKYKPAVCAGVPCKMLYPFRMTFLAPGQ